MTKNKVADHSVYAPECTCCDDWHTCARCGADKGNLDLWQAYCHRCAELERLEREIGRAVIGQHVVNNAIWLLDKDWTDATATNNAMSIMDKCLTKDGAITRMVARWRELHAEGA